MRPARGQEPPQHRRIVNCRRLRPRGRPRRLGPALPAAQGHARPRGGDGVHPRRRPQPRVEPGPRPRRLVAGRHEPSSRRSTHSGSTSSAPSTNAGPRPFDGSHEATVDDPARAPRARDAALCPQQLVGPEVPGCRGALRVARLLRRRRRLGSREDGQAGPGHLPLPARALRARGLGRLLHRRPRAERRGRARAGHARPPLPRRGDAAGRSGRPRPARRACRRAVERT